MQYSEMYASRQFNITKQSSHVNVEAYHHPHRNWCAPLFIGCYVHILRGMSLYYMQEENVSVQNGKSIRKSARFPIYTDLAAFQLCMKAGPVALPWELTFAFQPYLADYIRKLTCDLYSIINTSENCAYDRLLYTAVDNFKAVLPA